MYSQRSVRLILIIASIVIPLIYIEGTKRYPLFIIGSVITSILVLFKGFTFNSVNLLCPKNIIILPFYIQLTIIPLTIFIFGHQYGVLTRIPDDMYINKIYLLQFFSFLSFVVGWNITNQNKKYKPHFETGTLRCNTVIFIFIIIGIISIIYMNDNFAGYINSVFLSEDDDYAYKSNAVLFFCFIGKELLVLGSILYSIKLVAKNKGKKHMYIYIICSIILILFCSLGTNRANLLYPIICFIFCIYPTLFRIKLYSLIILLTCLGFYINNFAGLRASKIRDNFNTPIIENIQVYFQSAHFIAPILEVPNTSSQSSILPSLLETVPHYGAKFRDLSGAAVFNKAIYGNYVARDQNLPVYAEIYYNYGVVAVILFFILFGYIFRAINIIYENILPTKFLTRSITMYFILILNSILILSFTVLGQFLIYKFIPLIILIVLLRFNNNGKVKYITSC